MDYILIIDALFIKYDSYINFLGNLYFCEATTFYKQQQIDIIKNLILSIRYLTKINTIDINHIINYIKNGISVLINGPNENENIIEKYINMYYSKYIDKIIFSFMILLDYDEFKKLFLYIINWSLPYFSFWLFLRNLISENNFYSLYDEQIKEKIDLNNLLLYLKENNKMINNYLMIFLQKLMMIKIISKFNTNKENLLININNLSMENLFDELNMQNLYKILPKDKNNEINIIDIFENCQIL